jgi:hypothetical protein
VSQKPRGSAKFGIAASRRVIFLREKLLCGIPWQTKQVARSEALSAFLRGSSTGNIVLVSTYQHQPPWTDEEPPRSAEEHAPRRYPTSLLPATSASQTIHAPTPSGSQTAKTALCADRRRGRARPTLAGRWPAEEGDSKPSPYTQPRLDTALHRGSREVLASLRLCCAWLDGNTGICAKSKQVARS